MTDSLPPALTSDEWAIVLDGGQVTAPCSDGEESDFWVNIGTDVDEMPIVEVSSGSSPVMANGPQRHILAALCLYNQPYGFARDDLVMLETIYEDRGDAWLLSIMNRIKALLPPESSL